MSEAVQLWGLLVLLVMLLVMFATRIMFRSGRYVGDRLAGG